jgi:hypothetical protein
MFLTTDIMGSFDEPMQCLVGIIVDRIVLRGCGGVHLPHRHLLAQNKNFSEKPWEAPCPVHRVISFVL